MLRLLEGVGIAHIGEPEKLKTLLCPIVARGQADQERFYELFDQYWEQVSQSWAWPEQPPGPAPSWWKRNVHWQRRVLSVALLGGLVWTVWILTNRPGPAPKLEVFFSHPPEARIGDTVFFENRSAHADTASLRWEIADRTTGQVEQTVDSTFHLYYYIQNTGGSPEKEIRLISRDAVDPKTGQPATYSSPLLIRCARPPVVDSITAPKGTRPGETVAFIANLPETEGLELNWDFGDGATATGPVAEHLFDQSGNFEVRFTAVRTSVEGFCQTTQTHRIAVGQDKAVLAAKPLWKDPLPPIVNFSWGTWILLGLLGLAIIWFWVKWAARKPPPVPDEGEDLTAAAERFKAADKAPYFIPFRPQEGNVRVDREIYRFADVLRMRQEGLRKNLDVPASLHRTIAGGGFPQLISRADTVPTEYLFLIDEQAHGSHQSHLYRFLAGFLREREVLGEVFYFKNEPVRFWNDHHPGGLLPGQLHRLFPHHRLILLGDAHALLDPAATARPQVRPAAAADFRQWKQRLLLTPFPVVSWTYREGALHGLFAVFPSDTAGIGEAIKYIERGMEEEELPTYATWCGRLLEGRAEPDLNYRRWRTAAEHRDYLQNHPALYRWLCALAVYPKPDWNITLAIGHALAAAIPTAGELNSPAVGMAVNYDNLLLLARIPWLQSGDLSPRLRKELLADLDPGTEQTARAAVQAELEAVETLVQGSHANQEQQINLALQHFSLAPADPGAQSAISQLLALKLLTPRHTADLNTVVERYVEQTGAGHAQATTKSSPPPPDIRQFLDENKPVPERPPKPFFNRDFWLASTFTLLYLLIFLFAWNFGGTERLAGWLGVDPSPTADCREEFIGFYFLKKQCAADSAVLLHNQAVDIWAARTGDATARTIPLVREVNEQRHGEIAALFQRALEQKPDYPLAASNFNKFRFNLGQEEYHAFIADSSDVAGLQKAIGLFRSALTDSLRPDALHGLGLAHFYLDKTTGRSPAPDVTDRLAKLRQEEQRVGQSLERREKTPSSQAKQENDKLQEMREAIRLLEAELAAQDSARFFYGEIIALAPSYFDTLATYPHLQSLLFKTQRELQRRVSLLVEDAATGRPLDGVLVTADNYQGRTAAAGSVQVDMTLGERRTFGFTRRGYLAASQEIRPGEDNLAFVVQMQPEPAAVAGPVSNAAVLYFDADKATLRPDARLALDSVAAILMKNPDWTLALTGHTDNQATAAYNQQTSQRLAQAAADYLAGKGLARERLTVKALGSTQPALPNTSAQNRLANRRVELKVIKPGSELDPVKTTINIRVLDETKRPVPLASVTVSAPNTKSFQQETDMDGQLSFQGEINTDYILDITPKFNPTGRQQVLQSTYVTISASDIKSGKIIDIILESAKTDIPIPEMILVKGGTFRRGCDEKRDGKCEDHEKPVHDVTLSDFSIGKYEVTNEQYAAFLNEYGSTEVKDGPYKGQRMIRENDWGIEFYQEKAAGVAYRPQRGYEKHPVVHVSWFGASEYCTWLSQRTGQRYRLPTEAEWEYAARGGGASKDTRYSGSNNLDEVAWYSENSGSKTHPVGQKKANELGLYDMSGNVWEWCGDWYDGNYYPQFEKGGARNPEGAARGSGRVLRGGSWGDKPADLRCSYRYDSSPDRRLDFIGFRLARAAR